MSQLARKDLFYIELPKSFIPEEIEQFYFSYINRMPTYTKSCIEVIKSTLQSITIPSVSYSPAEVFYKDSFHNSAITRNHRASINPQDLQDKSIELTFKMIDGYLNYWILLDTFYHYYDYENRQRYVIDLPVHIMDRDGIVMFSRVYKDCILSSISDFQLSYSDNFASYDTFTITLNYTTSELVRTNAGVNIAN